jgi:hypothetical protein
MATGRELLNDTDYQLTVYVINPSQMPEKPDYQWLLETEAAPTDHKPLYRDLSVFHGYSINERAHTWIVRNENPATGLSYLNGKTKVLQMFMEIRFNLKLELHDLIRIDAPTGFILSKSPPPMGAAAQVQGATCQNWDWEPKNTPYLSTLSQIMCLKGQMNIFFKEPREYPELQPLKWRMDTTNVAKTPHVMENHWTVKLFVGSGPLAGKIRASEAVLGWDIRPQLENIFISIGGTNGWKQIAAGSQSSMAISFRAIQDADELELRGILPQGFDFTGCQSDILGNEVIETNVEKVRIRASILAAVQTTVRISNFKLGLLGGATKFNLITKLNDGRFRDERMNFLGGFRLPGALTVKAKKLNSLYSYDPASYPVKSTMGVRVKEDAIASFVFTVTQQANIGSKIRLSAYAYTFHASNFSLRQVSPDIEVAATVDSPIGSFMNVTLKGYLWVGTQYRIEAKVTTPTNVIAASLQRFSLEILDSNPLPVNTNDNLTDGFELVKQIPFKVLAPKSPPMALAVIELQINPVALSPNVVRVVAPPGFNFTATQTQSDCLNNGGTGDVFDKCTRSPPLCTNGPDACQESVLLNTLGTKRLTTITELLKVSILTPAANAIPPSFFVQLWDYDAEFDKFTELGWGEDTVGVKIRQMSGAGVIFPGIPNVPGQMAFRFETNLKVEANGKIRVFYPKDIVVDCGGQFLHQVGLKGDNVRCTNYPKEGKFEIGLPRPLPPGRQGFAVTSTAPNAINNARGNNFDIMVIAPAAEGGQVVDAAMAVPGNKIQHGITVKYLSLAWGSSEPNRAATVTVGFELLAALPKVNPPTLTEILIRVPLDFYQVIKSQSQVEISGDLPLKAGSQNIDYSKPLELRILLDEKKTAKLSLGQFKIQFPVWVPGRMPRNNVWLLTLCGQGTGTCIDETSPRALVTFPMAGFELNQAHPSFQGELGQASRTRRESISCVWILYALILLDTVARHLCR